ncbi:MAG TPA: cupin domain-containing protein [Anaerolineae bacterium]|nr:cupin domain-containing protein [Anaerolineae bacterium]
MSAIHKFTGNHHKYAWDGIEKKELNQEGLKGITKSVLIGTVDLAPNSIMRFFQIQSGGHSRLERHPQEHEVIVLHGKGKVRIGEHIHEVTVHDVVFISSNELHQFSNPFDEPFGFICVIPRGF